jgi:hypothetical protein
MSDVFASDDITQEIPIVDTLDPASIEAIIASRIRLLIEAQNTSKEYERALIRNAGEWYNLHKSKEAEIASLNKAIREDRDRLALMSAGTGYQSDRVKLIAKKSLRIDNLLRFVNWLIRNEHDDAISINMSPATLLTLAHDEAQIVQAVGVETHITLPIGVTIVIAPAARIDAVNNVSWAQPNLTDPAVSDT